MLRERRGFTLAELLIVLVIMAIVTAMALPRLEGMVRVSAVDGAANRLAADLQYTRVWAIRNGWPTRLSLGSTGSYTVYEDPTGANRTIRTVNLSRDYPGVTVTAAAITFDSRGMLSSGDNTITVSRQGKSATLTVSGVGKVYRD